MFRRRKQSDLCSVSLEITGPRLRWVVMELGSGAEPAQLRTGSVEWRREATELASDKGIEELATALKHLVIEHKLDGSMLQIAVSGEYCFTWSMASKREDVRRASRGLEERSALFVTLGPGQKSTAGSMIAIDNRRDHLLVSVANQKTLDAVSAAARQAGLVIERLEATLVALSRLLGRLERDRTSPVLLLNLHDGGAELGVSHCGRLLLDYRPVGQPTAAAEAVLGHLGRLQRYCEKHHEYAGGPLNRVYIFGAAELVHAAHEAMRRQDGLHVFARNSDMLDPRWPVAVERFPAGEFAAAIGSGLAVVPDTPEAGPNLMDRGTVKELAPSWRQLLQSGVPIAAALLISLGLWSVTAYEQLRCTKVCRQLAALGPDQGRAHELWSEIQRAEAVNDNKESIRKELAWVDWSQMLAKLARCAPDSLWLSRLQIDASGKISMTGTTWDENSVHEFMSWVERSPDWEHSELISTRPAQFRSRASVEFDVECAVTAPDKSSNRPNGAERK